VEGKGEIAWREGGKVKVKGRKGRIERSARLDGNQGVAG